MYITFSKLAKIWEDHKVKSDMVRVLKNKLKSRISIHTLKEYLEWEKKHVIDSTNYADWHHFDELGYQKAVAKKEARIELLEELIRIKERD